MLRFIFMVFICFILSACATKTITHKQQWTVPTASGTKVITKTEMTRINSRTEVAYLEEGKRFFEGGYYKRAMHILLPYAVDGNAEAQYAVGYMYYYGYGVPQDTDIGCFWIVRAARQQFPPAIAAYHIINKPADPNFHIRDLEK